MKLSVEKVKLFEKMQSLYFVKLTKMLQGDIRVK